MSQDTSLEEKKGEQLSSKALQEIIRPHVPRLIEQTLYLAEHCTNENVQLGAIKLLLAKVVPDLKAIEVKEPEEQQVRVLIDYATAAIEKVYGSPDVSKQKEALN